MGLSAKAGFCDTCGEVLQTCNGHFGYVKLALPVLHIGYLKMIVSVLQDICKVRALPTRTASTDGMLELRAHTTDRIRSPTIPSRHTSTTHR